MFVSGVLVDTGTDSCRFVSGQLIGLADAEDPLRFIPGQLDEDTALFVPGQNTKGVFYPGKQFMCYETIMFG